MLPNLCSSSPRNCIIILIDISHILRGLAFILVSLIRISEFPESVPPHSSPPPESWSHIHNHLLRPPHSMSTHFIKQGSVLSLGFGTTHLNPSFTPGASLHLSPHMKRQNTSARMISTFLSTPIAPPFTDKCSEMNPAPPSWLCTFSLHSKLFSC